VISTHILDLGLGSPAAGVPVRLLKKEGEQWSEVAKGVTNTDGRHSFEDKKSAGLFKIVFETESYLKRTGHEPFFTDVPVVFKIENTERKYHVPLLLSAFGYSTYRGS
jgi:5-hydroxyisourate hydrolase